MDKKPDPFEQIKEYLEHPTRGKLDEDDLEELKEDYEFYTGFSISKFDAEAIKYFINSWMGSMGFGREYNKLTLLAKSLEESGIDFSDCPFVYRELRRQ